MHLAIAMAYILNKYKFNIIQFTRERRELSRKEKDRSHQGKLK